MAGFIENIDVLTRHTPYVSQAPLIEAYSTVGREKQMMYEQGVQKIQSNIDNIAGLDVIRDVDKRYLQSKLNEVGTDIKKFAAGDFSNFQLANSVGGMVTKIGKDRNIQNAVLSASKYRKELSNLEAAKKEGKSSIQNEWDFNTKSARWLNSTELGESYNEAYTPYVDVSKKWMEVVKGLHSDLQEIDLAYETNPDGSVNYSKTLAAMQRMSKETVSSAKIENALRANLTPDELNQLSIDGRFTFRGYNNPEQLGVYAETKYNNSIRQNEEAIKNLRGLADLSTSNAEIRRKALATIKELETSNLELQSQLSSELEFIRNNPDEAKAYIYRNGAISQFAKAYSWEHNKANLLSNPVLAAEHWEKDNSLDRARLDLEYDKFNWNKLKDQFDMDLDLKKYQKEFGVAPDNVEIYGGESTNIDSPFSALTRDIDGLQVSVSTEKAKFLKGNLTVSPEQLENLISDYKSGKDIFGKDAQTVIPARWRSTINDIVRLDNKAGRKKKLLDDIYITVDSSDELQAKTSEIRNSIQNLPDITIDSPSGPIHFSQDELADFRSKLEVVPGRFGDTYKISRPLSNNEQLLWDLSFKDTGVNKVLQQYAKKSTALSRDFYSKRNELVNQEILKRTGTYIPRLSQIPTGKPDSEVKKRIDDLATSKIQQYKGKTMGIKGGNEQFKEDDLELAEKMLEGDSRKDIIYKKLTQGDKTYLMMVNGSDEVVIPLEPNETVFLPEDINAPTNEDRDLKDAFQEGNGSTNPTKEPSIAYFQRYDFPNTKLDVRADLDWDEKEQSLVYPYLHLNLGDNDWIPLTIDKPMSPEKAKEFLKGLSDIDIKRIFLNDNTVSDSDKERIKALNSK